MIAGVPLAVVAGAARPAAAAGLVLGVSTASFRDLPRVTGRDSVDAVIRAVQAVRATHIELALADVEPAPPRTSPFMGGSAAYPVRVVLTPEQIAATNAAYRTSLRAWRTQTPLAFFEEIGERLTGAGITAHACSLAYDESWTDAEIDGTFRHIKALGMATVSSPLTMSMAARVAPFAERHGMSVAIHTQVDGNAAGTIGSARLADALALSPAFVVKLDIGNLTASNCDAVAELRDHQSRVSHIAVKDRLRNGGASQPFGEGDTPIAGVLDVLRGSSSSIPALIEYDYLGLRSSTEEVAASIAYLSRDPR